MIRQIVVGRGRLRFGDWPIGLSLEPPSLQSFVQFEPRRAFVAQYLARHPVGGRKRQFLSRRAKPVVFVLVCQSGSFPVIEETRP